MVALNRFSEIGGEYQQLLTTLEAQESPAVRDIIRAVLQPVNQWRRAGREASLQFYALALVCPLPEVKETLDVGVAGFYRVVALLQRVLPHFTHEEHLLETVLHHQTLAPECMGRGARLAVLSKGDCNVSDSDEALERSIAFAEAAFLRHRCRGFGKTALGRCPEGASVSPGNRAPDRHGRIVIMRLIVSPDASTPYRWAVVVISFSARRDRCQAATGSVPTVAPTCDRPSPPAES